MNNSNGLVFRYGKLRLLDEGVVRAIRGQGLDGLAKELDCVQVVLLGAGEPSTYPAPHLSSAPGGNAQELRLRATTIGDV